ncbi:biotin--[acetyl-CoA-carboxylase] ligase [Butyrivibrio sp. VCD2006]|uniref:biotin--[acetyl-CoA-carboxylase] ligase n=1 Tax=Butyrivibrio sp. VCD2006 TaxID=1280664 RepID=UPI00040503FA|nr:biotin--[acetyl-CoA-carboxylase] ligase [Butyrivibrio sp. VCD2006]
MNKEKIEQALKTAWAARELEFFPVIDSTNNVAKAAGLDGHKSGFLAVADKQDAGRGSRGRSWVSPSGYNVFMSLMVRPELPMDKVSGLTLVMALSIAEGIEKVLNRKLFQPEESKSRLQPEESESRFWSEESESRFQPGIKWPNDIVLNKRKICGILTELHMMPDQKDYFVVIGVGINVNQPVELFPEEIRETAGSIISETGEEIDRAALIAACMKAFEENFEKYVRAHNLSELRESYEKRLLNIGRQVRILDPKGEYEAEALGVNDEGALLIRLSDGREETINAGEVSVRGLYGYV